MGDVIAEFLANFEGGRWGRLLTEAGSTSTSKPNGSDSPRGRLR